MSGTFFAEFCLVMNSYIVLRISYRVKDKGQVKSKKVKGKRENRIQNTGYRIQERTEEKARGVVL